MENSIHCTHRDCYIARGYLHWQLATDIGEKCRFIIHPNTIFSVYNCIVPALICQSNFFVFCIRPIKGRNPQFKPQKLSNTISYTWRLLLNDNSIFIFYCEIKTDTSKFRSCHMICLALSHHFHEQTSRWKHVMHHQIKPMAQHLQ